MKKIEAQICAGMILRMKKEKPTSIWSKLRIPSPCWNFLELIKLIFSQKCTSIYCFLQIKNCMFWEISTCYMLNKQTIFRQFRYTSGNAIISGTNTSHSIRVRWLQWWIFWPTCLFCHSREIWEKLTLLVFCGGFQGDWYKSYPVN